MAKPMYYWNGTAWEAVAPVVPQSPIAYQASEPSSPSTGDLWIDSDQDLDSYQRQLVRYRFNPSAGATSVSGVDANGATLSYTPGAEQVYLNGALLVRGSDYVATDGTSVTSLAALSSGDVLEVFAYVAFNPANTYTQSQVDGLVAPMGLIHLNTTSFSAVASQSINDVFSATYKNYKIVIDLVASTSIAFRSRLRVSAADNSTASSYTSQEVRGSSTTAAAFQTVNNFFQFGYANTNPSVIELSLINPFETSNTSFASFGGRNDRSASVSGFHNQPVSYTGITLIPESGTITGTARIYGLAN